MTPAVQVSLIFVFDTTRRLNISYSTPQACANYLILYRGARRFDSSWSQGPSYADSSTLIFAQARVSATDRRDDELDGH